MPSRSISNLTGRTTMSITKVWNSFWQGFNERKDRSEKIDTASDDSFPASDPPAWISDK